MSSDPPEDIDLKLHRRMLEGDPLASCETFERHYRSLVQRLSSKYRTTSDDFVSDAVTQALLDYFERPERFDPSRRSLAGYLVMAAERDLINLIERNKRRIASEIVPSDIELSALVGNKYVSDDPADNFVEADAEITLREQIEACAETEEELTTLRLMMDGVRSTAVFVEALQLGHLDAMSQRERVYLLKDRLTKRLRRRLGNRDA